MATIQKYKTDDGQRYRVRWYDCETQKSKSFDRWQDAKDFKTKVEHTLREGSYVAPSSQTVKAYLDAWIEGRRELSATTLLGYKQNIKHIKGIIGDIPVQRLTAGDIEDMQRRLSADLSGTSVLYVHRVLSRALNDACKKRIITNNPCRYADKPQKNKYKSAIVPPDMVSAYLDACKDTAVYPAAALAMLCGLRRGECLALRWGDIDFKANTVTVSHSISLAGEIGLTKSKEARTVSMPEGLAALLKAHRKRQKEFRLFLGAKYHKSDFIVVQDNGTEFKPQHLSKAFDGKLKKAKLPHVRFHDLRHTAASLMNFEGVALKTISKILGHSSIAITADIYTDVFDEAKRQAAAKMGKYLTK
jgi:integrase